MSRQEDLVRVLSDPRYWMYKCGCIITLAIVAFLLGLISYDPSFSIQNFYVPALNNFINHTTESYDSLIFFDLELQNANYKGVRYDAINLTFSYGTNPSMANIGAYMVSGFYQGKGKKAQRRDVAVATGSVPWEEAATRALLSGSTADFRVHLVTKVKFKNYFWYSGKKRIAVGGRVEVDDSGEKVERKPVKLVKSAAPPLGFTGGSLAVACLWVSFFLLKY